MPADPELVRSALARAIGVDVELDSSSEPPTLDVHNSAWVRALQSLSDDQGLDYFDWLSAAELPAGGGFQVVAHLAKVGTPGSIEHLLLRTTVPAESPQLASATGVFRGASWHERETYEMFGIDFIGHPHLVPLLLPDGFEGHPLKKDFVLVARAAKPWPGAKEPGESEGEASPSRRRMQPAGVPDASWGRPPGEAPEEPPERPRRAPSDRPPRRPRPAETAIAETVATEAGPKPDSPNGSSQVAPR